MVRRTRHGRRYRGTSAQGPTARRRVGPRVRRRVERPGRTPESYQPVAVRRDMVRAHIGARLRLAALLAATSLLSIVLIGMGTVTGFGAMLMLAGGLGALLLSMTILMDAHREERVHQLAAHLQAEPAVETPTLAWHAHLPIAGHPDTLAWNALPPVEGGGCDGRTDGWM